MLSEQAIKEFQELYEKEFGEKISKEEALAKGISLMRLYKVVCKPRNNIEEKAQELS